MTTKDTIRNQHLKTINDSTASMNFGMDTLINKTTIGLPTDSVSALSTTGIFGEHNANWKAIATDTHGNLKVSVDETLSIGGFDNTGNKHHIKTTTQGVLQTHQSMVRANTTEIIRIPDGDTGYSTAIAMNDNQYLAAFGDTDNTFNKNIFLEYSHDGRNFYRGAGGNAKIIIVSSSGNFYDQERIITKYVRISRPNTSGANETITLNFTRA